MPLCSILNSLLRFEKNVSNKHIRVNLLETKTKKQSAKENQVYLSIVLYSIQ